MDGRGRGFELDGPRFESRQEEDFSLIEDFRTGSGAHPDSYSMVTEVLSPKLSDGGRDVNHLIHSSAEVKKEWSYTTIPLYYVDRDNFAFTFVVLELCSIECYVGHLESKERLRLQPAQLFNFS